MATWGGGEETELDNRNQQRASSLAGKVSQLKSVAVDLEIDAYEHNRLLDGMSDDFVGGDGLLQGSLNRVRGVLSAGRGNRRVMCYIAAFIFCLFIGFYYILTRPVTYTHDGEAKHI